MMIPIDRRAADNEVHNRINNISKITFENSHNITVLTASVSNLKELVQTFIENSEEGRNKMEETVQRLEVQTSSMRAVNAFTWRLIAATGVMVGIVGTITAIVAQ